MARICILMLSILILTPLAAARIDLDYVRFRGTPIGEALLDLMVAVDAPERAALRAGVQRVLVSWEGRRSPPLMRLQGMPVDRWLAARGELEPLDTPLGPAFALRREGLLLLPLAADEALIGTPAQLAEYSPGGWPERGDDVVRVELDPDDLKLGALKGRILGLGLVWSADERLTMTARTPSRSEARSVRGWLNRRRLLIGLAASTGHEGARIAARLLAQGLEQQGPTLTVGADMEPRLMQATQSELVTLLHRQLRRVR